MYSLHWFDWIDQLTVWGQIVIGTLIGMVSMFIICFCIIGIQKILDWYHRVSE